MIEKQAKEVQKRLAKHNPFVRLTASNLAGKHAASKQKLLNKGKICSVNYSVFLAQIIHHIRKQT